MSRSLKVVLAGWLSGFVVTAVWGAVHPDAHRTLTSLLRPALIILGLLLVANLVAARFARHDDGVVREEAQAPERTVARKSSAPAVSPAVADMSGRSRTVPDPARRVEAPPVATELPRYAREAPPDEALPRAERLAAAEQGAPSVTAALPRYAREAPPYDPLPEADTSAAAHQEAAPVATALPRYAREAPAYDPLPEAAKPPAEPAVVTEPAVLQPVAADDKAPPAPAASTPAVADPAVARIALLEERLAREQERLDAVLRAMAEAEATAESDGEPEVELVGIHPEAAELEPALRQQVL
ncbi:MAG: hypothetical protein JF887_13025 [Candidatus Dormibacteraeota bacterium]|uniref:Uncharacterized protein n=1 Tax=Candidatus Amunia macphersoniae TaxID=3127014 RepID=A0A934KR83_9BACT|nr:hypothetical protein [Candidatus Dormibacteraeota bacterium]